MAALHLLKSILLSLESCIEGISGLEACLFDRSTTSRSGNQTEVLATIARYIKYEYNSKFALYSTEILNLLCSLASKHQRSKISLVGYFGGDAFSLCSSFVDLVNDSSLNAARDESLQMAIYSFVTTVIISQPGM
jgi:Nucleoporin subcomplex protein binding to Pom34